MEKIVKLEGLDYDRSKFLYYLKEFEDGVYVCRAELVRGKKKK